VAYAQTHIHHALDPSLSGSIQHKWKHGHSNVKPEQMWWRFRRTWVPGYEALLEKGIEQSWFDSVNIADRYTCYHQFTTHALKLTEKQNSLVFRWLAIPWLQKEADAYMYSHNTTRKRANRHKVLPNGIPDVMFENPETVSARDFKVRWL
jgi:hypothetical protein